MLIQLTNNEIISLSNNLTKYFNIETKEGLYLPAKINFYLCKNMRTLKNLAQEIDKQQQLIINHFGEHNINGQTIIPDKNIEAANQEWSDLLSIEQEVNIYQIQLASLDKIELSVAQMEALMFMIQEGEE